MKIVYQAYGRKDIIQQVLLSVSSLKMFYPQEIPFEIEIYTDQKASIESFFRSEKTVSIIEFTHDQLKEWRGEIQFVHRVKLEILKLASRNLKGPLIYLDGDTVFRSAPNELFSEISSRISLMHIRESSLKEGKDLLTRKIAKFVKGKTFKLSEGLLQIPSDTEMWNAGVIGVAPDNTKWFSNMIEMTDVLYSRYQKHVMEQLAVSYYLNRETQVLPSDDVIHHYWDQKPEFDQAIASYFSKHTDLVQATAHLSQFPWPAPKVSKTKVSGGILSKIRRFFESQYVSK